MVEMLNTMINSHLTIKIVENVTKNSAKSRINVYSISAKSGNLSNICCFKNKIALLINLINTYTSCKIYIE